MDFAQIAELCAPAVSPGTLEQIASVESSFNPWAIGVVGGRLARQPATAIEAEATAAALKAGGWDYSVGLVQVNQKNFSKYGLTVETAFDPCANLRVGAQILADCYKRAGGTVPRTGAALSCYYSGNFTSGYRAGYVAKVEERLAALSDNQAGQVIPVIPAVRRLRPKSVAAPRGSAPLFVSADRTPNELSPASTAAPTALLF